MRDIELTVLAACYALTEMSHVAFNLLSSIQSFDEALHKGFLHYVVCFQPACVDILCGFV